MMYDYLMQKRSYLKYIVIGLCAMAAGEFQVNVLVLQKGISAYFYAIALYVVLISIMFLVGKRIKSDIRYYFLAGLFGLVIEWVIFGNMPWVAVTAIQTGMFAWWASVFTLPRIFTDRDGEFDSVVRSTKKRSLIVLIAYSVISTAVTAMIPLDPTYLRPAIAGLMMLLGMIILNFQFIRFLARRSARRWSITLFMWLLLILGFAQFLLFS